MSTPRLPFTIRLTYSRPVEGWPRQMGVARVPVSMDCIEIPTGPHPHDGRLVCRITSVTLLAYDGSPLSVAADVQVSVPRKHP